MISFVCQFYSWSFNEVLALPIKTFLKFHNEALKMEAAQFRELLDIAIVPSMKLEYYKFMRAKYNRLIYQSPPKLPEAPPDYCLKADSVEAKIAVMDVFRSLKRGLGYGG